MSVGDQPEIVPWAPRAIHVAKVVEVDREHKAVDCVCGWTGPAVEDIRVGETLWAQHCEVARGKVLTHGA